MTLRGITVLLCFLGFAEGLVAHATTQPNASSRRDFAISRAPILIQPDFVAGRDDLVPFNFMQAPHADTNFVYDPSLVDRARKNLNPARVRIVDWSVAEIGGAKAAYFVMFRPISKGILSDRRADTESVVIFEKKNQVGPSHDLLAEPVFRVIATAAHGQGLMAASHKEQLNVLIPNFAKQARLVHYVFNKMNRDRVLDVVDGRHLVVSEPYTHALAPVTDARALSLEIDLQAAVIYAPVGVDIAEVSRIFSGAQIRRYELRSIPIEEILATHEASMMGKGRTCPVVETETWTGETATSKPLLREFRDKDGHMSGANAFWGWGLTSCRRPDGTIFVPSHYKDGGVKGLENPRPVTTHLHLMTRDVMPNFFSQTEIDDGALKLIYNGFFDIANRQPECP